jgi:hypothetical protein
MGSMHMFTINGHFMIVGTLVVAVVSVLWDILLPVLNHIVQTRDYIDVVKCAEQVCRLSNRAYHLFRTLYALV